MHRDGVPEGDKKRLYQHARLALHEMDAVDNLTYLGVNVSKVSYLGSRAELDTYAPYSGLREEAQAAIQAAQRGGCLRHLSLPAFDQVHARGSSPLGSGAEPLADLVIFHRSTSRAALISRSSPTFVTRPSPPAPPALSETRLRPPPPDRCGALDLSGPRLEEKGSSMNLGSA